MYVYFDVEIDIDKISVCLILFMGGNCLKSFCFLKSKILLNFIIFDFYWLDFFFVKLIDLFLFLVILLICKFYNFLGSLDFVLILIFF